MKHTYTFKQSYFMATFLMDCHRSFDKVKYYLVYCKAVKKNPSKKKLNLPVNGVFKLLIWNKIDILKKNECSWYDKDQNRYFEKNEHCLSVSHPTIQHLWGILHLLHTFSGGQIYDKFNQIQIREMLHENLRTIYKQKLTLNFQKII